ncbi:MAG: hypothetical protein R8K48_06445 [Gallionella sp.]
MKKLIISQSTACLFVIMLLFAQFALAVDYNFSGYGTVGYAQSDKSYKYLRYINKSGTYMRDTVFGAQLDVRFNSQWRATLQGMLMPAFSNDSGWNPLISWAFLSYRPTNDWLLRAGKLRVPFYLNAENMNVGATYVAARLPYEVYSVSPTMDFTGASFVKTWNIGDDELNLDGYWGQGNVSWRYYSRDKAMPYWLSLHGSVKGLLLTLHHHDAIFRAGLHTADLKLNDGTPFDVGMAPNVLTPASGMRGTYYTPSGQVSRIVAPTFNLGMDVGWGRGFRTQGEYVRRKFKGTGIGPNTESFYFTLLKELDNWTPYVTYAQIKSKNLATFQAVNGARVSALFPRTVVPAALINVRQREIADGLVMYDQYSWSLGTAYAVDTNSKIKAEWMVVHTGVTSSFVDAPVGGNARNQRINVFSLSYNFMF